MPPGKLVLEMARKQQRPRPGKLPKNIKMTTLLFLPRIMTPTPPE